MRLRPLDFIAPIGIGALAVGVCTWAAVVAPTVAGRSVSIACASMFAAIIAAFFVMRYSTTKPAYVTKHGTKIVCGERNRPQRAQVEAWIDHCAQHWLSAPEPYSVSHHKLQQALSNAWVFYLDQTKLTVWGKAVRGWAYPKMAAVGFGPINYIASLTRHEVSHIILYAKGTPDAQHHDIFTKTNLGA